MYRFLPTCEWFEAPKVRLSEKIETGRRLDWARGKEVGNVFGQANRMESMILKDRVQGGDHVPTCGDCR